MRRAPTCKVSTSGALAAMYSSSLARRRVQSTMAAWLRAAAGVEKRSLSEDIVFDLRAAIT